MLCEVLETPSAPPRTLLLHHLRAPSPASAASEQNTTFLRSCSPAGEAGRRSREVFGVAEDAVGPQPHQHDDRREDREPRLDVAVRPDRRPGPRQICDGEPHNEEPRAGHARQDGRVVDLGLCNGERREDHASAWIIIFTSRRACRRDQKPSRYRSGDTQP